MMVDDLNLVYCNWQRNYRSDPVHGWLPLRVHELPLSGKDGTRTPHPRKPLAIPTTASEPARMDRRKGREEGGGRGERGKGVPSRH